LDIYDLIERARRLHADRPAVIEAEASMTYCEFGRRIANVAACGRAAGWSRGERVAVLALNGGAFLEAYFAIAGAGAICVPLNTRLAPPELAWILRDSSARTLVVDARLADVARAALSESTAVEGLLWCGPGAGAARRPGEALHEEWAGGPAREFARSVRARDDVAQLYYTSGTTGTPKGVMLTHGNVLTHALAAIAELELRERDVWGHFAPLFHLADAWACFAITWVGGTHVCVPRFDELAALDAIERRRVTITNLVPTMLNRLVHSPGVAARDFSSLRRMLSGGAPIAPELVRRCMQTLGCEYVQTYGMTETSPYLTLSLLTEALRALPPEEQFRFRAKSGRPFLAVELRVVDDLGQEVPADGRSVGEIQARGPTVTPGYWQRPEETRAAFTPDGFLRTGDLATLDAAGYLDIVDRKKDVIISGGEKIYSTEVEHRLAEHPAVLEAAVYGVPDAEWGESVRAAVVLHTGALAEAQELAEFCRERLAGFKVPRGFEFLVELPRTGSGKIAKRVLRNLAPPAVGPST
jgi:fatty-acyl-CoA synthase